MSEKIEFTKKGMKQLGSVVQSELKQHIDASIEKQVDRILENRITNKLNDMTYRIEGWVKKRIDEMYWKIMSDALQSAKFQDLFKDEIIKYLHERWACGDVPFDLKFEEAMKNAIFQIVKEKGI